MYEVIALYLSRKITAEQYQERLKYTLSHILFQNVALIIQNIFDAGGVCIVYYTAI